MHKKLAPNLFYCDLKVSIYYNSDVLDPSLLWRSGGAAGNVRCDHDAAEFWRHDSRQPLVVWNLSYGGPLWVGGRPCRRRFLVEGVVLQDGRHYIRGQDV
jgi:hypothetical protein